MQKSVLVPYEKYLRLLSLQENKKHREIRRHHKQTHRNLTVRKCDKNADTRCAR